MKIAIIGANGFLARNIRTKLSQTYPDISLLLYSSSVPELFSTSETFETYRWPDHSLSNSALIGQLMPCDIIIFAAGAGIQNAKKDPVATIYALNLFEPVNLLTSLQAAGYAGRVVTFGTYSEIGVSQSQIPYTESSLACHGNLLLNDYCKSKSALTRFAFMEQQSGNLGFDWLHLVLTNIYGLGDTPSQLIPYIFRSVKEESPMRFTSGNQLRQFTYIEDLVESITGLMTKANGIYNLTNVNIVSVKKVILTAVKLAESKFNKVANCSFDIPERRDLSMQFLALDTNRVKTDWNINIDSSLENGLKKYLAHEVS